VKRKILTILTVFVLFSLSFTLSSCKACDKSKNKSTAERDGKSLDTKTSNGTSDNSNPATLDNTTPPPPCDDLGTGSISSLDSDSSSIIMNEQDAVWLNSAAWAWKQTVDLAKEARSASDNALEAAETVLVARRDRDAAEKKMFTSGLNQKVFNQAFAEKTKASATISEWMDKARAAAKRADVAKIAMDAKAQVAMVEANAADAAQSQTAVATRLVADAAQAQVQATDNDAKDAHTAVMIARFMHTEEDWAKYKVELYRERAKRDTAKLNADMARKKVAGANAARLADMAMARAVASLRGRL
jgi:hypothetical protein